MLVVASSTSTATAQTFTLLHSFDGTDGATPVDAPLIQATNGSLYGTTFVGGVNNAGSVFKITPSGTFTNLYSFCSQPNCTDGAQPYAGVLQARDGNFYGTTYTGGAYAGGTVFRITPSGTLTTIYSFCSPGCSDGDAPQSGLILGSDGNFYGVTTYGGPYLNGSLFKISPSGTLTTLYSFCAQSDCADGRVPASVLVQGSDGNFYGATYLGGANDRGTLFKITPTGTLTTLYSFCSQSGCTDGSYPQYAALAEAPDGVFYGTTPEGGAYGEGLVFKITSAGKFATVYSFCSQQGCPDGASPYASLIQAPAGIFYGTTSGGSKVWGSIFKLAPSGTLSTLYTFCSQGSCPDGANPWSPLVQHTNGTFYGTTAYWGPNDSGTVFSLSVGLDPFVRLASNAGTAGKTIQVLGQSFTGATAVSFNGTAAAFKVVSDTYLRAVVPVGATTGFVTVTTPGGTLTSNQKFRVRP